MNRRSFNLFLIFVIFLFGIIDAKHKHYQPANVCTVTDVSTETVTSTIDCTMTTPTPYDCPDTKQVPDNCDKCEQTTTITCIPTTTVCNSNFISEDICCSSGGPARNGSTTFGQLIRSIPPTTAEDCCRACYKDSNCTTYYFYNSDDGTDCGLYNNEGLCYQLSSTPTENEEYGEVGCGLCKP